MNEDPDTPTESPADGQPAEDELSGLQWLSRQRPEAMEHLMSFFRESGRHLDPKTRFLISVVTKVVNFTPRASDRYIPRAMREGASRDEILDAILCAYPAAGLTKIIDAVDILRSIPDPPHQADVADPAPADASAPAWHAVGRLEDLPEGVGHIAQIDDKRLALFRRGDRVHAVSNTCVHLGGQLSDGTLTGKVVTCPLHGWQFDLSDGHCLTQAGGSIEVYPTRIQEDRVEVQL